MVSASLCGILTESEVFAAKMRPDLTVFLSASDERKSGACNRSWAYQDLSRLRGRDKKGFAPVCPLPGTMCRTLAPDVFADGLHASR